MARQAAGHFTVARLAGTVRLHVHNGSPLCLPCAQTATPRHPAAAMLQPATRAAGYLKTIFAAMCVIKACSAQFAGCMFATWLRRVKV